MTSEKPNQNYEGQPDERASGFEALASVEFDPERAEFLKAEAKSVDTSSQGEAGEAAPTDSDSSNLSLEAFHEEKLKPAGELSLAEATREYLDILYNLSLGFESPEGKTGKAADFNRDSEVIVTNPNGYSGKEERAVRNLVQNLDAADDTTKFAERELSLDMADKLIFGQAVWQAAAEKFDPRAERYDKGWGEAYINKAKQPEANLAKYETGIGGALHRVFKRKEYESLKDEDARNRQMAERYKVTRENGEEGVQTRHEQATRFGNKMIEDTLLQAYSPDYGYGHHRLAYGHDNPEYREKVNEEYNNKFFSDENAEKIARAIELRNRLYPKSIQINAGSSFKRFEK